MDFVWQVVLCGLGAIGIFWEMAHRLAHAHGALNRVLIGGIGLGIIYLLLTPIIEWRMMEGNEIWAGLLFGFIGIMLLIGESCHWLHERHMDSIMKWVAVGGCLLLVLLLFLKPAVYEFSALPTIKPDPVLAAQYRNFGPGPGPARPADATVPAPAPAAPPSTATARSATASAQVGFGVMPCDKMTFDQRKRTTRCATATAP